MLIANLIEMSIRLWQQTCRNLGLLTLVALVEWATAKMTLAPFP